MYYMKNLLFFLGVALFAIACTKNDAAVSTVDGMMVDVRVPPSEDCDKEFWVCHATSSPRNPFTTICISDTSYFGLDDPLDDGHDVHAGDILLDADGDGFTAENPCNAGSQDDCDDTNPAVFPGSGC